MNHEELAQAIKGMQEMSEHVMEFKAHLDKLSKALNMLMEWAKVVATAKVHPEDHSPAAEIVRAQQELTVETLKKVRDALD